MRHETRSLRVCIGACAAALLAAASVASADEKPAPEAGGPPTWYAQALSRAGGNLNVTHFWSKGSRMRSQVVVGGREITTIVNGSWYYTYDGLTKRGRAIERQPEAVVHDRPDHRPFADELELLIAQGAEKIREEDQGGQPTEVYQVTDAIGRRELWVSRDAMRVPLRLEIYDRKTATRRYVDYVDWRHGLDIPDDFFEPDPRAELEKVPFEEYLRGSDEDAVGERAPVLYPSLVFHQAED